MLMRLLELSLLMLVLNVVAHGAPSWPVPYANSPDSMPIIQVRLAPPRKEMPEVTAALGSLEMKRIEFEKERMFAVDAAFNASLKKASEQLPALIDRLMRVFEKPAALMSLGYQKLQHAGLPATSLSFHEAHHQSSGQELTTRVSVHLVASPDPSLESRIKGIEQKRSKEEEWIFAQAESEMAGLTEIVQKEVEAQVTRHAKNLVHAAKFGLGGQIYAPLRSHTRVTGFLQARQPILAGGSQLAANVLIKASEEPFLRLPSLVEDLERKRDASESLLRTRLLELELKLLQAENEMVSARLGDWMEHILQIIM